jgi:Family of unknown function (DUF5675)
MMKTFIDRLLYCVQFVMCLFFRTYIKVPKIEESTTQPQSMPTAENTAVPTDMVKSTQTVNHVPLPAMMDLEMPIPERLGNTQILFTLSILHENADSTISKLMGKGQYICICLEDGERVEKEYGKTRIDGGMYRLYKKTSGKFYTKFAQLYGHLFVVGIKGLPRHKSVLFHGGNTVDDTLGCPIVGDRYLINTLNQYSIPKGASLSAYEKRFYPAMVEAFNTHDEVWLWVNRSKH